MRHITTIQTEFTKLAISWWDRLTLEAQRRYVRQHRSRYLPWQKLGTVEFVTLNLPDDTLTITADSDVIPASKKLRDLLSVKELPDRSTHYSFSLGTESTLKENPYRQKASPTEHPITATRVAINTMINHISSRRPRQFTFTAANNEPSRIRLYDALRPRLEPLGYKLFNNSSFKDQDTTTWHYVIGD